LKNYKDMLNVIKETEEGVSGTVRIGTGYPTVPLLAGKILSLRKHYPAVEFNITQEDPDNAGTLQKQMEHIIGKILPHFGMQSKRFTPWTGKPNIM